MSIAIRPYKKKSGQISWSVVIKSGDKQKYVKKDGLIALGLSPSLTYEEAKSRIETLNAQERVRQTQAARSAVATRFEEERDEVLAFLPAADIEEFERKVIAPKFLGTPEVDHSHKTMVKWRAALRTMGELKLDPSDWTDNAFVFFNYFIKEKFSPGYVERIIAFLNLYGYFYCKKYGRAFLPLPRLAGRLKIKQKEAYRTKNKRGIKSDPLSPDDLEAQKGNFKVDQYNWLFIGVWLGLRPEEIDSLHDKGERQFKLTSQDGIRVLHVYQSKLVGIDEELRWKMIPLLYVEQKQALYLIREGNFKRPLAKTLQKYFTERTTTYCGRKGFTDLMLSKGQSLEDISQWLGHQSIERTWRDYKNKKVVHFKKPGKEAA